ncbi:MAG: DUF3991 domain-containing protein [Vulcanibacillus sp.]
MFTKEQIYRARNVSLYDYFLKKGFLLKDERNNRFRVVGYGGLIIYNCFYYHFSTSSGGNAVDCLVNVFGLSVDNAVKELNGCNTSSLVYSKKKIDKCSAFKCPPLSSNLRRSIAYLTKTRGINVDLVRSLIKDKLILQDLRGNVIFPYLNEKKIVVGGELHGSLDWIDYKGCLDNSDFHYPFMFNISDFKNVYFFESAIDALSFVTMFGLPGLYVSLSGLKKSIFCRVQELYPDSKFFSCVDSDKAGQSFNRSLVCARFFCILTPVLKDWNEDLLSSVNNLREGVKG